MSAFRPAFDSVLAGNSLPAGQAESAFGEVLDESVPEPLVAAFLVALKMKSEASEEIAGCARAMRSRARALNLSTRAILDTAGTGGDHAGTFNISTGAALIAAAAGVAVAKHGNRAVSGRIGGADVLEKFGVKIDCAPEGLERCLRDAGCCFIFAPAYHPAMARLAELRRALATRTLFNLMGPLVNPAFPRRQITGVPEERLLGEMARAIAILGSDHSLVVHGSDGIDEISLSAETMVVEIRGESIRRYEVSPEQFGIARAGLSSLRVDNAEHAAELLRGALAGGKGPAQDVLALNGGAAIYAGDAANSLAGGVAMAQSIIKSGRALETLEKLRRASIKEAGA